MYIELLTLFYEAVFLCQVCLDNLIREGERFKRPLRFDQTLELYKKWDLNLAWANRVHAKRT